MWKRLSLRTRILLVLAALVLITVGGGLISILYTYMMEGFFSNVVDTDVAALEAAQQMEQSLVMQKGFVTYFYQDADPRWLDELQTYQKEFETWLGTARQWAETDKERKTLNEIESRYVRYTLVREDIVRLYKEGSKEAGARLQKSARNQFFEIIDLCRRFRDTRVARIVEARETIKDRARLINVLACIALLIVAGLAIALAHVLLNQVLGPIRQLASGATTKGERSGGDEVAALSRRLSTLIADVDQTRNKLKWSREHLQQAEKWALVGKLAAGVAHSVRNPLTSVKMRLFSMERTLSLTSNQKEDFEVISEEIRHIDTIVGNFLEFSRPPKLKMQRISPSDVVDNAIQLLHHRLDSYEVKVTVDRDGRLPKTPADPDQLKEVLVNLMVNACEAMVKGGLIKITEEVASSGNLGTVIKIGLTDTGPGIPQSIQEKLFQPFFSTKEEGTGLGLSIATRIVEEHGGWLDLKSREGSGASFIITLPVKEEQTWEPSS